MTLELKGAVLGLGSMVRLDNEDATGLFVVLARGAFRPDGDRNEVVPRYLVGPHPYGETPDRETFPILAAEVQEVVHEGYTDAADAAFLEDLLDQMENGRRPTTSAQQFKGSLTVIPEVQAIAPEDDGLAAGVDPFFELQRLVDQQYRRDE
ncbi:DUF4176 domain-containing protein [Leifsonia sp. 2TAF2]|uniref:DUF4176 domain-containing protein n=1 Tax=Leifsonia sp. 2TAF2 TaxID=3233009 RepID=UPI003F98D062